MPGGPPLEQHARTSNTASAATDAAVPIVAREGWAIIAAFAAATALAWSLAAWWLGPAGHLVGAIGVVLTGWSVWFFRDPSRETPAIPGVVISPADGVVCQIGPARPPKELEVSEAAAAGMTRVSVFMNVFNVHVNRCPTEATVEAVAYHPGKFFNASLDKASEHNERCSLRLRLPDGREMACVQIAGLVARRIVCKVPEGTPLRAGQRYGLIKFGSRVDVYLPAGVAPRVSVGQKMVAGETVIAILNEGGR